MPFEDITLNDGRKMPSIAFGSGSVNKGKDIHQYIEQAIEAGFSHMDTAQYYNNEESVGKAIRQSGLDRSEVYITSKYSNGNQSARSSLEDSLRKIGVEYLDLYLIHSPRIVTDYVAAWKEFEKFREEGLTKSIGVSNFGIEELQFLLKDAKVTPAVNQIRLHPYNYNERKALLEYQAKHGIVLEAFGSLAPIHQYPGGPVDAPLKQAAERLGITPNQVLFLWAKAKGAVIVTTSSRKSRLEEYIAAGDLPPLTKEEVEALDAAGAQGPPAEKKVGLLSGVLARRFNWGLRRTGAAGVLVGLGLIYAVWRRWGVLL